MQALGGGVVVGHVGLGVVPVDIGIAVAGIVLTLGRLLRRVVVALLAVGIGLRVRLLPGPPENTPEAASAAAAQGQWAAAARRQGAPAPGLRTERLPPGFSIVRLASVDASLCQSLSMLMVRSAAPFYSSKHRVQVPVEVRACHRRGEPLSL